MTGNFGTCRACGAQVLFIKMKSGKTMPCDSKIITFYPKEKGHLKLVTADGNVVSGEFKGEGEPSYGYIPISPPARQQIISENGTDR